MLKNRYFFYSGLCVFIFAIFFAILFVFFPYQKMLSIAFQSALSGNRMYVSFIDVRKGFGKIATSRIIISHDKVHGQPLYEIEKLQLQWNPFSVLKGTIDVYSTGKCYGGIIKFSINNIPLFWKDISSRSILLKDINLENYPKERLPWFKSVSGTLNGTFKSDIRFFARESEKANFSFTIKDGFFNQINTKGSRDFSLRFKDISIEGRGQGDIFTLDKVTINCQDLIIKGNGVINTGLKTEEIKLNFTYESLSTQSPLSGKGTITVSGSIWQPEILVIRDPMDQDSPASSKKTS